MTHQNWPQQPAYQPPRKSSALPWIITGILAVVVIGGLAHLFLLNGPKDTPTTSPTPNSSTPATGATGTPTTAAPTGRLKMLEQADYPEKVGDWTLRFILGNPTYEQPDGAYFGPDDLAGPWITSTIRSSSKAPTRRKSSPASAATRLAATPSPAKAA